MKPATANFLKATAVWVARIATGALFILSGWAKSVDPRGFVYKITEYLNVWGITDVFFPGLIMVGAIALSIFEMVLGVLLLTGSLRRSSAIMGLVVMAFMLPLTVYIYVADPVADCGCFGDLLVVSNFTTMMKNVVATLLLVVCLVWHGAAKPLYRPDLQWLVVALTTFYGIVVAFVGWQLQPMVDFRPFAPGTSLLPAEDEDVAGEDKYIYERDGVQQEFALDELPDSTWTFVDRVPDNTAAHAHVFEIFDGDDEVTYDVLEELAEGDALILGVAEPGLNNLTRSRMAGELYRYAEDHDIKMIGVVALSGEALDTWKELVLPPYPLYSSSDTSIKELVRGSMGLVYLHNGTVVWKRNVTGLPPDMLERPDPLENVWHVDDGKLAVTITGIYGASMLVLLMISALTTITITLRRKNKVEKEHKSPE